MTSSEIRKKFLKFFESRGHKIVPSSSLIPDDPSVLLTTAGMQQFKRYYTGELDPMKDFGSKNTASIQKSFRTSDIDEVGDESHLTFFEMLGNFSFGGYFKKEAIRYAYDFIEKEMKLQIEYATVFDPTKVEPGDWRKGVPFDKESYEIWRKEIKLPEGKVKREGIDNFWGPTGAEGPCGPTTEIYVKNVEGDPIEIWNIVFNEYYCNADRKLKKLGTPGVDTGMGLERLVMVSQNVPTIFATDLFAPLIGIIPTNDKRLKRILADHIRASVHLIADGVEPSNKGRGYILRRLLRRAGFHAIDIASGQAKIPLGSAVSKSWNERASIQEIAVAAINSSHFGISEKEDLILAVINKEIGGFFDLLKSRKELREIIRQYSESGEDRITGEDAFKLFSTFGIPIDYIKDEAIKAGLKVDMDAFTDAVETAYKVHQKLSRAGAEKKFGGHGLILDTGELKAGNEAELKKVLRLHTATHLLQRALREVLGPEVEQRGSDITPERTRFDFSFPRKLTPEEMKKVEDLVNEKINEDLPVGFKEMTKSEAEKSGALYFFKEKYPERVKVYYVGKNFESAWSKEFCGGPHVTHTGEIGKFRITKEEAVGAGMRRVRGIVE